jgi:ATP-binding cassette subfamily F protein uup
MFIQPANMLVMDEPTNDLDMETLELLEDLLANFEGTLILVSHDRTFLDNVVSSLLVFEGDYHVKEYVGGYTDWLRQRPKDWSFTAIGKGKTQSRQKSKTEKTTKAKPAENKPRKLSYKEQRELEAMPAKIESLEAEQLELQENTSQADFYQQDQQTIASTMERLKAVNEELEQAYIRWEQLDS